MGPASPGRLRAVGLLSRASFVVPLIAVFVVCQVPRAVFVVAFSRCLDSFCGAVKVLVL